MLKKIKHTTALPLLIGLATVATCSYADTRGQIMFSKYLKYGFCMEKFYGQPWTEKSKLQTVMNRWGAQEPTVAGIANAQPDVKAHDMQCRIENGIQDEPRPR